MTATPTAFLELPDLDHLEALARAATPGPWAYQEDSDVYTHIVRPAQSPGRIVHHYSQDTSGVVEANARFTAGANPAAVLALIALARRAQPEGEAPQADLVELLKAIRPNYGAVGSRDVDVTAQRERIDRAIVLLSIPNGEQAAALGAHALYAWLPLEPTEAMVHAAEDLPAPRMFGKVWRAMASAGPCAPIQMILHCPACGVQHIDAPDERTEAWGNPPHRSHLCHGCGHIWRPADVATEGVAAIQTRGSNDSPAASLSPLCGAQHAESGKEGGLTIGEVFKAVGGWMNGGELGYPSFGSMDALRAYTQKMVRSAIAAQQASAPGAKLMTYDEFSAEARRLGCKLPADVCAALAAAPDYSAPGTPEAPKGGVA
jgi:hypothetical protein